MTKLIAQSKNSIPDSLRNIEVVKWRVERLIYDAYMLRSMQRYSANLEYEISVANKLIQAQDSAILIKQGIIEAQESESSVWKARFENQKELTKQERRGKRRWRIATIAITAGSVYLLSKTLD